MLQPIEDEWSRYKQEVWVLKYARSSSAVGVRLSCQGCHSNVEHANRQSVDVSLYRTTTIIESAKSEGSRSDERAITPPNNHFGRTYGGVEPRSKPEEEYPIVGWACKFCRKYGSCGLLS
jgi:hypothetical protein